MMQLVIQSQGVNFFPPVSEKTNVLDESLIFYSHSPAMYEVQRQILSQGKQPLLLTGELGAGHRGLAHWMHLHGSFHAKYWTEINGAVETQLQAKLVQLKKRHTEQHPENESVFIENIEKLNRVEQAKIERILQQEILSIRWCFATTVDLKANVKKGLFSKTLYALLNLHTVEVPSLRSRSEDIISLATRWAKIDFQGRGWSFIGFSHGTELFLKTYAWPGNGDELQAMLQGASLLGKSGEYLDLDVQSVRSQRSSIASVTVLPTVRKLRLVSDRSFTRTQDGLDTVDEKFPELSATDDLQYTSLKKRWIDAFEKDYLTRLLKKHAGNVSAASRVAQLDRSNFLRLLRKHGIKSAEFRQSNQSQSTAA